MNNRLIAIVLAILFLGSYFAMSSLSSFVLAGDPVLYNQVLYQYVHNPKNSSQAVAQSCRLALEKIRNENLREWQDVVDDNSGEAMVIWMPVEYVESICSRAPLLATSLLDDARHKAEAALRAEAEKEVKTAPPSGIRNKIFYFFKSFRKFFRAKEAEGKDGDDLKPCSCKITKIMGKMEMQEAPDGEWRLAGVGDIIDKATNVSTGFDTEVKFLCKDRDGIVNDFTLGSLTQIQINEMIFCNSAEMRESTMRAWLQLEVGSLRGMKEKPEAKRVGFKVSVPVFVCSVKG